MKKLLVFHPVIAPYRVDFFNALSLRYDMEVCLFWRNLKDQKFNYPEIEKQLTFTPKYLIREELGLFVWLKSIWKELSDSKPSLVYACEFGLITILILIHRFITGAGYRIVVVTDDSFNMLASDNHFTRRHKYAVRVLSPLVDEIQTVEPRVAMWYRKKYGKGIFFPIICEDNVAVERQKRALPISERYVSEYGLEGKKVLLFVGRLVGLKNIEFAIRAFAKANIPDCKFIIVGSGEMETYLRTVTSSLPDVFLVGRYEGDALYAWYNVANVFSLQSTQESFGAVINEALVAGCTCLVSKDAGSNCLIEDGVNGYVIDPYDEDDYVEKLIRLMEKSQPLALPLSVKGNRMSCTFSKSITELTEHLDNI